MDRHLPKTVERHHWWPQSLSRFWTNNKGHVYRIDTGGRVSPCTPRTIARIKNGHSLFFADHLSTAWDQTFEHYFETPDGSFPKIVAWLTELAEKHRSGHGMDFPGGYRAHPCNDENLELLRECLVSLVFRSPNFRSLTGSLPKQLNPGASAKEHDLVVKLNLLSGYQWIVSALKGAGKLAAFMSTGREFIYGDGLYHNLSSRTQDPMFKKMLVPLTPDLAVLYACPMQYFPDPPLVTKLADRSLVDLINETVKIYSSSCLFYRSEMPDVAGHFLGGHLAIVSPDPIDQLIATIPGAESWTLDRLA
jgi:hypothetical protein